MRKTERKSDNQEIVYSVLHRSMRIGTYNDCLEDFVDDGGQNSLLVVEAEVGEDLWQKLRARSVQSTQ